MMGRDQSSQLTWKGGPQSPPGSCRPPGSRSSADPRWHSQMACRPTQLYPIQAGLRGPLPRAQAGESGCGVEEGPGGEQPESGGRPSPARLLEAERLGREQSSVGGFVPSTPYAALSVLRAERSFAGLSPFISFYFPGIFMSRKPSPSRSTLGGGVGGGCQAPGVSLEYVSVSPALSVFARALWCLPRPL